MKTLPYFQFWTDEWFNGDISLLDMRLQGLFLNICLYYWVRGCELTETQIRLKFKDLTDEDWNTFFEFKILKRSHNDRIQIAFLDEQLKDFEKLSRAGLKGAKARWENRTTKGAHAIASKSHSNRNGINTNTNTNINKNKRIKEKVDRKENLATRKLEFRKKVESFHTLYPQTMRDDFYYYWTEHNETGYKMRFEMEKTFDVNLRLKTWARRDKNFQSGQGQIKYEKPKNSMNDLPPLPEGSPMPESLKKKFNIKDK